MGKEKEIWRKCYDIAMIDTDDKYSMFTKELLLCVAHNVDKEIHPKRAKDIFVDCYKLLDGQINKPNWTEINEITENLINVKYSKDDMEKTMCAELISVVINHLDRTCK